MILEILGWNLDAWQLVMALLALFLTLTIAFVIHECAHAWMALKQGDGTAKTMGRLTLNPAKHVDPLGLICLAVAGFGWAKPVPVNPFNYRNFRRGNFWVSIAGVISNFILAFLFSFLFFMMDTYCDINNLGIFFLWCVGMFGLGFNVSLMIFNLLPIYPLDGYNILVSFVKPNNAFLRFMRENGLFVLLLFVVFGGFLISPLLNGLRTMFLGFWGLFF